MQPALDFKPSLTRRQCALAGLVAGVGVALGTAGCAVAPAARATGMDQGLDLYLLVGQSNMAGRGAVEAVDRIPSPRVLALDAAGVWAPAADPIHFDKSDIVGVGPGRSFGLAMAQAQPERRIGLVPCAVGGTRLALWEAGAQFKDTGARPWDDTVRRIGVASVTGGWKGVLFHQGESDSNEADAPQYAARLERLVLRLRTTLRAGTVPFLIGQMGHWNEQPWSAWRTLVDAAQRDAARQLSRTAFVSSAGLRHKGDFLHFDAPSARQLGQRYAQAMLAMTSSSAAGV